MLHRLRPVALWRPVSRRPGGGRSLLVVIALFMGLAPTSEAQLMQHEFFVDPTVSYVQIEPTSAIVLDLPGPLGTLSLPITAQSDPAVSGNTLPGLGLSDGLSTAIEGGFQLGIVLPGAPGFTGTIGAVHFGRLVELSDSGQWQPGPGGAPGAGKLAGEFGLPSLGLGGELVLRDLALSLTSGGQLSYVSADAFSFPAQPIFPGVAQIFVGVYDGDLFVDGLGLRGGVLAGGGGPVRVQADAFSLTRLGSGDEWQIVMPFTWRLESSLTTPISATAEIDLSGRLVARTVPEPAGGLSLLAGATALWALAGRRLRARRPRGLAGPNGSREPRLRPAFVLAVLLMIAVSTTGMDCVDPQQLADDTAIGTEEFIPDEDGDGTIEDEDASYYAPGEGDDLSGATSSAQNATFAASITETGQPPVTTSCSGGSCQGVEILTSGCAQITVDEEPEGFRVTMESSCTTPTVFQASGTVDQNLFNASFLPKSFRSYYQFYGTELQLYDESLTLDGTTMAPLNVEVTTVPDNSSSPITTQITWQIDYTPTGISLAELYYTAVPFDRDCRHDYQCADGEVCLELNRVCVTAGPSSFCENARDCSGTDLCNTQTSRCGAPGGSFSLCNYDSECVYACTDGFFCTTGEEGDTCTEDEDCLEPFVCGPFDTCETES